RPWTARLPRREYALVGLLRRDPPADPSAYADLGGQGTGSLVEELVTGLDDPVELAEDLEADDAEHLRPRGDERGDGGDRELRGGVGGEPGGVDADRAGQRLALRIAQPPRGMGVARDGDEGESHPGSGGHGVLRGRVAGHGRAVDQGVLMRM